MQDRRDRCIGLTFAALLLVWVPDLRAQGIEVAPFGGYRFGGDFFEILSGRPVDTDGAPALGVALNVPLSNGYQIEGLFTHQQADILTPAPSPGSPIHRTMSVDHWQGGGLQEFDIERPQVRPFLTGSLGLTRFAGDGDSEIRFSVAAGGGVKLFPSPNFGVRLDGRVFATFVDADARAVACAGGTCFVGLNLHVVWQAEFTTGLVFKFR
jgi:hypothetical protein